jgi:hypothetical protein
MVKNLVRIERFALSFFIVILLYFITYFALRSYAYIDTTNSTSGTIGNYSFVYCNKSYARAYPISKADAKLLLLFHTNQEIENNWLLSIFVPLERLELLFRGVKISQLTMEEKNEIIRQINNFSGKKMVDVPF